MQAPQRLKNAGYYDPQLQSEKQDRLEYRHVEPTRGPGISPLLYQHVVEYSPFPLRSLEVPDNVSPSTFIKGQNTDEVFECIQLL